MQAGEGQPGAKSGIDLIPPTPRAGRIASRSQHSGGWRGCQPPLSYRLRFNDLIGEPNGRKHHVSIGSPADLRRAGGAAHGHGIPADAYERRPHPDVGDRTSLSLLSFGFTISQVFEKLRDAGTIAHAGAASNFGIALVILGILMLFGGIVYHVQFMLGLRHARQAMKAAGLHSR